MKFLQVSDLHMTATGPLYGLDPEERLRACIADINNRHADAAHVIVTGDLAHHGEEAAYRRLKAMLADLVPPAHLLIGNHDHRDTFRRVFDDAPCDGGYVQFSLETAAGRFICLDTNDEGHHHGLLGTERLAWLAREVESAGDAPVYLFMHHPPFPVGIRRMDAIALRDAEGFAAIVAGRSNVRHLFFGHLHRPISGTWKGVPFANLPGLNHQVALDFAIEDQVPGSHEPPAYAVVFAGPDRTIVHLHNFLDRSNTFNL